MSYDGGLCSPPSGRFRSYPAALIVHEGDGGYIHIGRDRFPLADGWIVHGGGNVVWLPAQDDEGDLWRRSQRSQPGHLVLVNRDLFTVVVNLAMFTVTEIEGQQATTMITT